MFACSRQEIAALLTALTLALAPDAWASPMSSYTAIDLGVSAPGGGAYDRDAQVVRSGDGTLAYRFIPAQGSFTSLSPIPWPAPQGGHYDGLYKSPSTLVGAGTLSTNPNLALFTYSYWDGRSMVTAVGKAERGTDGAWNNAGTITSGRDVYSHDGASILGLNSHGQVLLTANNGMDSWGYGVRMSEHPGILLYDTVTGRGQSLEWLLPMMGGFRNVIPSALDEEGRVLVSAEDSRTSEKHLFIFSPSDLSAAPVPEPSTLVALALGGLLAWRRLRPSDCR